MLFMGDIEFPARKTSEFFFLGEPVEFKSTLAKGLVAVGGYFRKGKFIQGYRRSDLLANAVKAAANPAAQAAATSAAADVLETASGKAIADLSVKTLTSGKIPSRGEIGSAVKVISKEAAANPVKFLKESRKREAFVRQSIETATGKSLPSNPKLIAEGFKKGKNATVEFVKNNPDLVEEMAVNGAGFVSSLSTGPVGDLAGALATRKAITDIKALRKAGAALSTDEAFKSAKSWEKFKQLRQKTLEELKKATEDRKDNLVGDSSGWAIGNTSAEALSQLPVLQGVPLKGAAVAIPVVPKIVKAAQRLRSGEDLKTVTRDTVNEIKDIPAAAVRAGNEREQRVREYLERRMLEARQKVLNDLMRVTND